VLGTAQRALDPGRRDLDGVVGQVSAQRIRDARAERMVDAFGVIDEDGEAVWS
jgi:hypothetical protein